MGNSFAPLVNHVEDCLLSARVIVHNYFATRRAIVHSIVKDNRHSFIHDRIDVITGSQYRFRNIALYDDKVFLATQDAYLVALDARTGKLIWETRLTDVPSNAPISYSVNGKQYIAIGVGNGGAQATGFTALVPEIQNVDRSPAVWVFQLP